MDATFMYSGEELDLFARARHWKAYWSGKVRPYLGRQVLEVGAGIGSNAQLFHSAPCTRWVGLEPDASLCARMATVAQSGGLPAGHEIRCGVSTHLRSDEAFDTILYIDVLEHIEDDRAELARVARHLQAGGHIVIVSPAHNFLYSEFDRKIGHFRRYDRRSLRAVVPPGLHVIALHYLDCVGMLASLANRLLLRHHTPKPGQIHLWDVLMVPASNLLDPLMGHLVGKSIICVLRAPGPDTHRP